MEGQSALVEKLLLAGANIESADKVVNLTAMDSITLYHR